MSKGSEIGGWEPAGAAVLGYNFNDRLGNIASFSYEQTNNHVNVLGGDDDGDWDFAEGRRDPATAPTNLYTHDYQHISDRANTRRAWGASVGVYFPPTYQLQGHRQTYHNA